MFAVKGSHANKEDIIMAFIFQNKPTATIKAKELDSTNTFTINGVTPTVTTADAAAEQINKIWSTCGKTVTARGMIHDVRKEAVEDE